MTNCQVYLMKKCRKYEKSNENHYKCLSSVLIEAKDLKEDDVTENTEVKLLINFAYPWLSQCAKERPSPPVN